MKSVNITLVLFVLFAFGLPIVGMQTSPHEPTGVHTCTGACYERWKEDTGGVLAAEQAKALAREESSPNELSSSAAGQLPEIR